MHVGVQKERKESNFVRARGRIARVKQWAWSGLVATRLRQLGLAAGVGVFWALVRALDPTKRTTKNKTKNGSNDTIK